MDKLFNITKENIANELIRGEYAGNATAAFLAGCMLNNRRFIGTTTDLVAFLHEEAEEEVCVSAIKYCYKDSENSAILNDYASPITALLQKTVSAHLSEEERKEQAVEEIEEAIEEAIGSTDFGCQARTYKDSGFLSVIDGLTSGLGEEDLPPKDLATIQGYDVPDIVKTFLGATLVGIYGDQFSNNDIIRTEMVKLAMAEKIAELNYLYEERESLLRSANFDASLIGKLTERIIFLESETKQ